MKAILLGSELFIAVSIVLSPKEAKIFEELNKTMGKGRKAGKPIGITTLKKELDTTYQYTLDLIYSLKEKIDFAYEIKEQYRGGYRYFTMYQKKRFE